jgi:hypothetical protein
MTLRQDKLGLSCAKLSSIQLDANSGMPTELKFQVSLLARVGVGGVWGWVEIEIPSSSIYRFYMNLSITSLNIKVRCISQFVLQFLVHTKSSVLHIEIYSICSLKCQCGLSQN